MTLFRLELSVKSLETLPNHGLWAPSSRPHPPGPARFAGHVRRALPQAWLSQHPPTRVSPTTLSLSGGLGRVVWAGLLGPPGLSIPNFSFAYGWGRELVSSFCFARTSLLSNKSINLFFLSILKLATYRTPHWATCFYFGYFCLEISLAAPHPVGFPIAGRVFSFLPLGAPLPFSFIRFSECSRSCGVHAGPFQGRQATRGHHCEAATTVQTSRGPRFYPKSVREPCL